MTAATVKGWCPGAYRPMASGDGLIVRVRPMLARITAVQALGLCDLAEAHGNGLIELTNRANLQLRGVREESHGALLTGLGALGLLDPDPAREARRNILMTPLWQRDDPGVRLAQELVERLDELPELSAKFGFAVDCGPARVLSAASADIRLEAGAEGLVLRGDGAASGRSVEPETAIDHLIALAQWFAAQPEAKRFADVAGQLPSEWIGVPPVEQEENLAPGPTCLGPAAALAFGQITAGDLRAAMRASGAAALRLTPWRVVVFEGGNAVQSAGLITDPADPLLRVDACPGAPHCASSTVETRSLARALAPQVTGALHVSGCAKGCARRGASDVTLIGTAGRFDLVRQGCAWDEPLQRGLSPAQILAGIA